MIENYFSKLKLNYIIQSIKGGCCNLNKSQIPKEDSNAFIFKNINIKDETFIPSSHVEEKEGVHYSMETGHKVEWASEQNWCFRYA